MHAQKDNVYIANSGRITFSSVILSSEHSMSFKHAVLKVQYCEEDWMYVRMSQHLTHYGYN